MSHHSLQSEPSSCLAWNTGSLRRLLAASLRSSPGPTECHQLFWPHLLLLSVRSNVAASQCCPSARTTPRVSGQLTSFPLDLYLNGSPAELSCGPGPYCLSRLSSWFRPSLLCPALKPLPYFSCVHCLSGLSSKRRGNLVRVTADSSRPCSDATYTGQAVRSAGGASSPWNTSPHFSSAPCPFSLWSLPPM